MLTDSVIFWSSGVEKRGADTRLRRLCNELQRCRKTEWWRFATRYGSIRAALKRNATFTSGNATVSTIIFWQIPEVWSLLLIKLRQPRLRIVFMNRNDFLYQCREIRKHYGYVDVSRARLWLLKLEYHLIWLISQLIVHQQAYLRDEFARSARIPLLGAFGPEMAILGNDLVTPGYKPAMRSARNRSRVVGFIANPAWLKKGFPFLARLIRAAAETDLQWRICGAGVAFDRLTSALGDNASVKFVGSIDDPVREFYPHVDVIVVPSVVDHFPNVVLEAAALNVPIIHSRIPCHSAIVGEFGAFELNDVSGCLEILTKRNNQELQEVATRQRRFASKYEFDWIAKFDQLLAADAT